MFVVYYLSLAETPLTKGQIQKNSGKTPGKKTYQVVFKKKLRFLCFFSKSLGNLAKKKISPQLAATRCERELGSQITSLSLVDLLTRLSARPTVVPLS